MEEKMNDNLVKIYYFASLYRPRIHFSIGFISNQGADNLQWDQYQMKKSTCRTDVYEQEFLMESDQYIEFVFCSDSENAQEVKWENPRQDQKQKLSKGNNFLISKTGIFAVYQGYIVQVTPQRVPEKIVIFTDIDGTLYGNPVIHENFKRYFISNGFFCNPLVVLVYSTGRGLTRFKQLQKGVHLLFPDILIGGCGTEIYILGKQQVDLECEPYKLDEQWIKYITQDNWNLTIINSFVQQNFQIANINHDEGINKYKGSFVLTEQQSRNKDGLDVNLSKLFNPFKSYTFIFKQALIKKANKELNQCWKYVMSGCGTHRFLDILPERADKGSSLQYVCQSLLKYDSKKSVAFGDSLNDADLLVAAGKGYIVGNAQDDLIEWYTDNKQRLQNIQCSEYKEGEAIAKFLEKYVKEGS